MPELHGIFTKQQKILFPSFCWLAFWQRDYFTSYPVLDQTPALWVIREPRRREDPSL